MKKIKKKLYIYKIEYCREIEKDKCQKEYEKSQRELTGLTNERKTFEKQAKTLSGRIRNIYIYIYILEKLEQVTGERKMLHEEHMKNQVNST